MSGQSQLGKWNGSQIMQRENTLSRSYLKVIVFIQRLFYKPDNLWFILSTLSAISFIKIHTSVCRWAEIGALMEISRSPIIFRASSGQIGSDGGTDIGLTAAPAADCTCHWSDFLFVQWSYLLSARDLNLVDKNLKIVDNCLHVSWLGNTHVGVWSELRTESHRQRLIARINIGIEWRIFA